jgi:hypothetical protein
MTLRYERLFRAFQRTSAINQRVPDEAIRSNFLSNIPPFFTHWK